MDQDQLRESFRHIQEGQKSGDFNAMRSAINKAEVDFFAILERQPNPLFLLHARSERLVAHQRYAEAAALLEKCVVAGEATVPPHIPWDGTRIARLVIHSGYQFLGGADAEEIAQACGMPVRLIDLFSTPPRTYAAADSLVIFGTGIDVRQSAVISAIKQVAPNCPVVAWLIDNHHCYVWNAVVVDAADVSFPAHATDVDYLFHWAARKGKKIGAPVPLCTTQWSSTILAQLYREFAGIERSDALSGHFTFYPVARFRNLFLAEVMQQWPEANLSLKGDWSFHNLPARERFLSWRQWKTSVVLPLARDLPMRLFDSLAAGQVPIVPRDVLDLDSVIPPADQVMLPIIRLDEYSVDALRAAHRLAIAAFDNGGEERAVQRHTYVLQRHMFAHRVRELVRLTEAAVPLALTKSARSKLC